jgi:hypothetical protein
MAYDAEFIKGFDKYGPAEPANLNSTALIGAMSGEWNGWYAGSGYANATSEYAASLLGPGQSLWLWRGIAAKSAIFKSLGANYARFIGGFYFQSDLVGPMGITIGDGSTDQLTVSVEASGLLAIREGGIDATILATSTQSVAANTVHVLEWDVTIHNSAGIYKVWLDGVPTSLNASSQNTRYGSSNNYGNAIRLAFNETSNPGVYIDHFYNHFFINAVSADTPLLTNAIVETQFPTSDSLAQFTPAAGILGTIYNNTTTTVNPPGANKLALRKYTAPVNSTVNSIGITPEATSGAAKMKGVIYADLAGVPHGAPMSDGTEVVATVTGTALVLPLVTPQSLVAGTPYWIGFYTDTSVNLALTDNGNLAGTVANTYGSGAPTTPVLVMNQASYAMWGNLTGLATNWSEVNTNPAGGDYSYVVGNVVGNEDRYGFPALSSTPNNIYTMAVKASVRRTDAGLRTVNLMTNSGTVDGNGLQPAQAPAASYGYLASYFDTDPNTFAAWGASALNAATSGVKIIG